MNDFLALFSVDYYDELIEGEGHTNGIIYASSHSDAAKKLEEYFGENNVGKLTIELFDLSVLTFDEKYLNTIKTIISEA